MAKHGVQGWRAPGLPGATAALPPGAKAARTDPKKLVKLLRTFDNTRTVAAMQPYAASADAWLSAVAAQIAGAHGGTLGPAEMAILSSSALQLMWSRFLFDRAAIANDGEPSPDMAMLATKIADASTKNLVLANELRAKLAEHEQGNAPPADPLAAFADADDA